MMMTICRHTHDTRMQMGKQARRAEIHQRTLLHAAPSPAAERTVRCCAVNCIACTESNFFASSE